MVITNRKKFFLITLTAVFTLLLYSLAASAAEVKLEIKESSWELRPGLSTKVWSYGGIIPGTPIIVKKGDLVTINGINKLPVATNIHWHGLTVPNDQDGPSRVLKPGKAFKYSFKALDTGTYWYHSHHSPVLEQVDLGLSGAFIVKAPEDKYYSGDHILVLDDWYLDSQGKRLEGTSRGNMERYGNVETVNGKTGTAIKSILFKAGELHKLRFINASTAAFHKLKITGHRFRVTHTDGHPLVQPYSTNTIILAPGERIDVELAATGQVGKKYFIQSDRSSLGMKVPIVYGVGKVPPLKSPFTPPKSKIPAGIEKKKPDFVLELNSTMDMSDGHQRNMGSMTRWTINGKSHPNTTPLKIKVGQTVKIRFWNKDTQMGHGMDHPMHLHGGYFVIVSQNGKKPAREMWKDTVNVPPGEYVDVAFTMSYPGKWLLHCHILDHEDGGLMTSVIAK